MSPKRITFTVDDLNKKWQAIYKIENDKLYVATNLERDKRPSLFLAQPEAGPGAANHVRVYRRGKEFADQPLRRAKVGDYTVFKMSGMMPGTLTVEVIGATDSNVTIRMAAVVNGITQKPMEETVPRTLKQEQVLGGMPVHKSGQEILRVNGKEYRCDWKSYRERCEISGRETGAELKVWTSVDAPLFRSCQNRNGRGHACPGLSSHGRRGLLSPERRHERHGHCARARRHGRWTGARRELPAASSSPNDDGDGAGRCGQ